MKVPFPEATFEPADQGRPRYGSHFGRTFDLARVCDGHGEGEGDPDEGEQGEVVEGIQVSQVLLPNGAAGVALRGHSRIKGIRS